MHVWYRAVSFAGVSVAPSRRAPVSGLPAAGRWPLLERIPRERVRVAESGYRTRAEIERLEELGADAVLIGEALLRQGDVRAGFQALFGASEAER